jgi:hypothetical protein
VAERHDPGFLVQQALEGFQVELAVVGDGDEPQDDPLPLPQEVPGDDVGVVLHLRQHDLVAGLQRRAQAGGDQVDGLGAALGEHHLRRRRVDEPRHGLAGVLVGVGGLVRQGVQAAVHVGVGMLHGVDHGVDHRPGLLGGGG